MLFNSALVAFASLLAAAPSALATITITGPSANTYWVQNTSNNITWEFGQGDPNPISITVTNPNTTFLNGPFSIAEHVDLSNKTFTVTNVTLNVHDGYVINFVNGSNASQIYAQSSAFSVKTPGTPQASQPAASGASPSATSPSGNGSATSSGATGSSTSGAPSAAIRAFDGTFAAVAPMLGVSAAMAVFGALVTL